MSAIRASLLFRNIKQVTVIRQNLKSTMVYQVDKTAAQKLIDRQVAKNKELQKFWAVSFSLRFSINYKFCINMYFVWLG